MQPDPPDSSTPFDEFGEGRHSLRAVKVRLALTLIAVAILPLAALAPLARSVLDDPRIAQRERLNAQSAHMATEARHQLEDVRATMLAVSAVPTIRAALLPGATAKDLAAAAQDLDPVLDQPTGLVGAVAILDGSGAVQAQVGNAADVTSSILMVAGSRALPRARALGGRPPVLVAPH